MGRGGIYFRQTLPSPGVHQPKRTPDVSPQSSNIQFKEIESAGVNQMVDSSSVALLAEINSKAKKPLIWPWILILSLCLLSSIAIFTEWFWLYWFLIPLCCGATAWAIYKDKLRKTIVLFYELEPHIEQAYQNFHAAFDSLTKCSRVWHIDSQGKINSTYDWKVNAGASSLVKRRPANPDTAPPSYFQCNISIPSLPAGGRRLYFLPDRVLLRDATGFGSVNFEQIEVNSHDARFIEDGTVPNDAKVVDSTWRYLNKKGGPDRRFNNNRKIPIVLYEEILLTSNNGLREMLQISRTGVGDQLRAAIRGMAAAISQRENPATDANYIKCPCQSCGVHIEFPASALGTQVACPRCGAETVLYNPGASTY
jgi:hypothetical protein